jgi:hypothetical protein
MASTIETVHRGVEQYLFTKVVLSCQLRRDRSADRYILSLVTLLWSEVAVDAVSLYFLNFKVVGRGGEGDVRRGSEATERTGVSGEQVETPCYCYIGDGLDVALGEKCEREVAIWCECRGGGDAD